MSSRAPVRPPGTVVHHSSASSGRYVGSPSLAMLPDGSYLASHDHFGPGCNNDETFVYRSSDRGRSWQPLAQLTGQWWSSLFVHGEAVYLLGTTTEYGDCVIRRSTDGGQHWTEPLTSDTGLLRRGRFHTAPVPVVRHAGRLWRAIEDAEGEGGWGEMFRARVMSIPEDADLLDAGAWQLSAPVPRNESWLPGGFGGWLEGNAVPTPDGALVNLLRVALHPDRTETIARADISADGELSFDPEHGFIDFPGGAKKFTIRWVSEIGRYLALVNDVPAPEEQLARRARNTLSLISSPDLVTWHRHSTLLHYPDVAHHGFQYVDWLIDGHDLVWLSRTAWGTGPNAAHSFHDANYLTFHRIEQYRDHFHLPSAISNTTSTSNPTSMSNPTRR